MVAVMATMCFWFLYPRLVGIRILVNDARVVHLPVAQAQSDNGSGIDLVKNADPHWMDSDLVQSYLTDDDI
ncbi:hypothetical protein LJR034_006880 [Caballeronia sp. LjRoot34]|uniref:hypothetical protein n=1 Tax=Caballeronia sp. LjRoot34 TaxID=3342325 RepID=UPI003ECF97B5